MTHSHQVFTVHSHKCQAEAAHVRWPDHQQKRGQQRLPPLTRIPVNMPPSHTKDPKTTRTKREEFGQHKGDPDKAAKSSFPPFDAPTTVLLKKEQFTHSSASTARLFAQIKYHLPHFYIHTHKVMHLFGAGTVTVSFSVLKSVAIIIECCTHF